MPGIVAPPGYPEELTKYAKMMKLGVPEAAVRGKMATDGFDDDMYDKYLNPATAITLNQQQQEPDDNEEKKEAEVDELDPNQPESNQAIQSPQQQNNQQQQSQPAQQPSGYFSSQNYVPPADSELKMDTLQPVPVKKTLLIVNTFIVNTAAFLNKFVTTCESKLHKIHTDIQRMETTMLLLESKLASIDWLRQAEQGQAPVIPKLDETVEFKDDSKQTDDGGNMNNEQKNDGGDGGDGGGGGDVAPPLEPEKPAEDPLLSDPNMIPWFKMLKFGVPAVAVTGKMAMSGIDEDTINRVIELHNAR